MCVRVCVCVCVCVRVRGSAGVGLRWGWGTTCHTVLTDTGGPLPQVIVCQNGMWRGRFHLSTQLIGACLFDFNVSRVGTVWKPKPAVVTCRLPLR